MMDAIFEAILEIVLMPIEPFIDWIDHIIDEKTKKYNKFLRNMIKVIVFVLGIGIFLCLFMAVIDSYLQKAELIPPKFSTAFVNVCVIANTFFLAYAVFFGIFRLKDKKQKYVVIPVTIIVFIFNAIFLYVMSLINT